METDCPKGREDERRKEGKREAERGNEGSRFPTTSVHEDSDGILTSASLKPATDRIAAAVQVLQDTASAPLTNDGCEGFYLVCISRIALTWLHRVLGFICFVFIVVLIFVCISLLMFTKISLSPWPGDLS